MAIVDGELLLRAIGRIHVAAMANTEMAANADGSAAILMVGITDVPMIVIDVDDVMTRVASVTLIETTIGRTGVTVVTAVKVTDVGGHNAPRIIGACAATTVVIIIVIPTVDRIVHDAVAVTENAITSVVIETAMPAIGIGDIIVMIVAAVIAGTTILGVNGGVVVNLTVTILEMGAVTALMIRVIVGAAGIIRGTQIAGTETATGIGGTVVVLVMIAAVAGEAMLTKAGHYAGIRREVVPAVRSSSVNGHHSSRCPNQLPLIPLILRLALICVVLMLRTLNA
ncbi:MAG: hypothetical protein PUK40_00385 [Actinomycetaceae bacterium]|nr:hypothetical protein [Arcanobacterium sp.]MDD7504397.1 hypothetical protein [Actinomycetaceae bacterium]MDY6143585.1 hypothetical protein [Arcanobacterium sp.]